MVLAVTGCALAGGTATAVAAPMLGFPKIQHVVMIMQENRTFDHYFGTYPGADGIPPAVCVNDPLNGGCVAPFHSTADLNNGGPHAHQDYTADLNGGRMDGFVGRAEQGSGCTTTDPSCSPCTITSTGACIDVMGYHDAREIPNYWSYAQNFVLQDHMFENVSSWSWPQRLATVSGWSANCTDLTQVSTCHDSFAGPGSPPYPAGVTLPWTDVTYLLHNAGVSWGYYVFQGTEPDCESDSSMSCAPVTMGPLTASIWNPLPWFADVQADNEAGNIQSLDNFYNAVQQPGSCGLPNVSWITPSKDVSEHPVNLISKGQTYVTTTINTIMNSPCWDSTAIFVSWDDWGGFYDHVVPPVVDELGYGLRVPGLVISPYAKTGYIDHQVLSHDAYLKFIEDDFLGGQRLDPATDGRPDPRPSVRENAVPGDLVNDFDFTQAPRPPLILPVHPPPGPASTPPGTGFVRPHGATPMKVSLVPAYKACTAPNNTHGAPLSFGSCSPPQQASSFLTLGTPDANGQGAKSVGSLVASAMSCPSCVPPTADVKLGVSITDVRNKSDLLDYTGQLRVDPSIRITDRNNAPPSGGSAAATVNDTDFPFPVPCASTADPMVGSTCSISTTANAILPGALSAGQRAIWQLGQVRVFDGGSSGTAGASDATLFEDQGIFVP